MTTIADLTRFGPRPPRLLPPLFSQFARPSGLLGRLAGRIMAKSDADDRWVTELLDVQSGDRVLDVGCGPGVTVGLIAERATDGMVSGVDPSVTMLRQAATRNRAAIQSGRVELRRGDAAGLPYPEGSFTKACAMHSVYFWPSMEDGLREIARVLLPAGIAILAVRMRNDEAGIFEPTRYGHSDARVDALVDALRQPGLRDVTVQRQEIGRESITAVSARR